jgi:hypothetical protein
MKRAMLILVALIAGWWISAALDSIPITRTPAWAISLADWLGAVGLARSDEQFHDVMFFAFWAISTAVMYFVLRWAARGRKWRQHAE